MSATKSKVGVWLIGARGGVATTTLVGLAAMRRGLTTTVGLTTALPAFERLDLVELGDLVFGGHEIRGTKLSVEAERMHRESHVFSQEILTACREDLDAIDANIRPGTLFQVGSTIGRLATENMVVEDASPRAIVERLQADLKTFMAEHDLARLIVVNVASTEPLVDLAELPVSWAELDRTLDEPKSCLLPASSLYAIAALDLGCAYINFTPSLGSTPPAIDELARLRGICHAGRDGKTGETLLKSVLAPMFARRNLNVMSWVGHNIFGNLDGRVLDDPANKATKIQSKDQLLGQILGYSPQTLVSIEFIESLGDWKTAWDHVHFQGFLQTPMTLQLTWQGSDSILAAPLVIDLIRLVECSRRRGETGALGVLGCFFKSPLGTNEVCFDEQFQTLMRWVNS